jgi:hypothetical protein
MHPQRLQNVSSIFILALRTHLMTYSEYAPARRAAAAASAAGCRGSAETPTRTTTRPLIAVSTINHRSIFAPIFGRIYTSNLMFPQLIQNKSFIFIVVLRLSPKDVKAVKELKREWYVFKNLLTISSHASVYMR